MVIYTNSDTKLANKNCKFLNIYIDLKSVKINVCMMTRRALE